MKLWAVRFLLATLSMAMMLVLPRAEARALLDLQRLFPQLSEIVIDDMPISHEELMHRVKARFETPLNPSSIQIKKMRALVGKTPYIDLNLIHRAQSQYSFLDFVLKYVKAQKIYGASWKPKKQTWTLLWDDGKSIYQSPDFARDKTHPTNKARFILTDKGLIAIDGHHKILVSMAYGAQTIPGEIVHDWTGLSAFQVEERLRAIGASFPYDNSGHLVSIEDWIQAHSGFGEFINNFNRFFITMVTLRVNSKNTTTSLSVPASHDKIFRASIDGGMPMEESYDANILTRTGLFYDPIWGINDIPRDFILSAYQALRSSEHAKEFPALRQRVIFPPGHLPITTLINWFSHKTVEASTALCRTKLIGKVK